MSVGRDAILARIREALRLSAPMPGAHDSSSETAHASAGNPAEIRAWLPAAGANYEENAALFARNSADLKTNFLRCATLAAAQNALREIAAAEQWKRVAFHAAPL